MVALLTTYHVHGEQQHPTVAWLKELIKHPTEAVGLADLRHWSERTAIMLCMQTTDTSIEFYWDGIILRSRPSGGTPRKVHLPIVEEFVDRLAKKMDSRQGATVTEIVNRTATAHFTGESRSATATNAGLSIPTSGCSARQGFMSWTEA
jgi:cholesterol oxidase